MNWAGRLRRTMDDWFILVLPLIFIGVMLKGIWGLVLTIGVWCMVYFLFLLLEDNPYEKKRRKKK